MVLAAVETSPMTSEPGGLVGWLSLLLLLGGLPSLGASRGDEQPQGAAYAAWILQYGSAWVPDPTAPAVQVPTGQSGSETQVVVPSSHSPQVASST